MMDVIPTVSDCMELTAEHSDENTDVDDHEVDLLRDALEVFRTAEKGDLVRVNGDIYSIRNDYTDKRPENGFGGFTLRHMETGDTYRLSYNKLRAKNGVVGDLVAFDERIETDDIVPDYEEQTFESVSVEETISLDHGTVIHKTETTSNNADVFKVVLGEVDEGEAGDVRCITTIRLEDGTYGMAGKDDVLFLDLAKDRIWEGEYEILK